MDEGCRETVSCLTKKAGEVGDGQGRPSDATGQSLESPKGVPRRKDWRCPGSGWNVMWGPVDRLRAAGLSVLDPPTRGPYDAMNKRSTGRQLVTKNRVAGEGHSPTKSLHSANHEGGGGTRRALRPFEWQMPDSSQAKHESMTRNFTPHQVLSRPIPTTPLSSSLRLFISTSLRPCQLSIHHLCPVP